MAHGLFCFPKNIFTCIYLTLKRKVAFDAYLCKAIWTNIPAFPQIQMTRTYRHNHHWSHHTMDNKLEMSASFDLTRAIYAQYACVSLLTTTFLMPLLWNWITTTRATLRCPRSPISTLHDAKMFVKIFSYTDIRIYTYLHIHVHMNSMCYTL